jgi:hypothetical protein
VISARAASRAIPRRLRIGGVARRAHGVGADGARRVRRVLAPGELRVSFRGLRVFFLGSARSR